MIVDLSVKDGTDGSADRKQGLVTGVGWCDNPKSGNAERERLGIHDRAVVRSAVMLHPDECGDPMFRPILLGVDYARDSAHA
ncbi:hypothetical protein [Frankia sp. CiP3]|uniref:hypothetical protein n=1 Tax=Frankia sp. CiP3 TaxID=2880971 RepID=UPI001EF6DE60|nr:hypothetical protein [Frankia sp. CiP3]